VLNASIADVATEMGLKDFTVSDGSNSTDVGALAKAADVAVLCLGLTVSDEGEGHDRQSLGLPQAQLDLASTVVAAQPYSVAVLVNGGALAIEPLLEGASAVVSVVEAFYPAQAGATAIMQTLLGQSNRFGKLPYTVYPGAFTQRSIANYNLMSDGGLTYRYYDNKYGRPLFQFGHGLSYSTFSYEWATTPNATVRIADLKSSNGADAATMCYDCSSLAFSVKVSNTGTRIGDAVVLGFVVPKGVVLAGRALFDFGRVSDLAAGQSSVVTVGMDSSCKQAISHVDEVGVRWVSRGKYTVSVGDIVKPATHELTVVGDSKAIDPHCRFDSQ
jgi:hypothetical protein